MARGPLSGLRIIDLAQAVAGPWCCMLLGDLGAEVIKIEPPSGDVVRGTAGPNHKGESYHYLAYNRNKKDLVLDLHAELDTEAFYDLVKLSDVVVTSLKPGSAKKIGVDYNTLAKINSRIICCYISGYGFSGPYRNQPCYDQNAMALSGLMSLIGEPGRPPVRPVPPLVDLSTGLFSAIGILSAVVERERTGTGQRIEVPMLDVSFSLMMAETLWYFLGGGVPQPQGSGHPTTVPFGVYPTKEGSICLGPCWPRICRALGADWLMDDPRFASREARAQHKHELNAIITELLLKEKASDWLEVLRVEEIAAVPVNTLDKALIDPQVVHNKVILPLKHPLGGQVKMPRNPIKMATIDKKGYTSPPTLGQHTREILARLLGYSEEMMQRMKEEKDSRDTGSRLPKARRGGRHQRA